MPASYLRIISLLTLITVTQIGYQPQAAYAEGVSVHIGPTTIANGDALGGRDITIRNNKLAVAFAVETAPPWGVARGGIVDIAEVRDGVVGSDHAALLDFMPNDWSSWPTTYQRVSIEKNTPEQVVIKTERDWETANLVTYFSLSAGEDKLHVVTEMTNNSSAVITDVLSGYVLWAEGGYLFGVPGMNGVSEGKYDTAIADWTAAYGEDWVLGLHAPFADHLNHGGRDVYTLHTLQPGQSRSFEAWLQVGAKGELAPMVKGEIALQKLKWGQISGRVTTVNGKPVANPALIIKKVINNVASTYAWVLGENALYNIDLPSGEYEIYATAKSFANSEAIRVHVVSGEKRIQNFNDLQAPGHISFQVSDKSSHTPLDARITIEKGAKPLIEYFGKDTFFTELNTVGNISIAIAPGHYQFKVAAAEGFTAKSTVVDVNVIPASQQVIDINITRLASPAEKGWYGADMHHHSDVLDGFTAPAYVLRSELAAGLDVTFLSDHGSVINNKEMNKLANSRQVPFIPATEYSPSWAHFNAYPLDADKEILIDTGTATVQEIFADARRMGADVIQVNHPYIAYGYFHSQETHQIPGGYSEAFDLIEVGAGDNSKIIEQTWRLWNQGKRHYFSAGSDVHDVWRHVSGTARMYVKVEEDLTPERFVEALHQGHAYASLGPLIYPELMFGEELNHPRGTQLTLNFSVQAINGLESIKLIEQGQISQTQNLAGVLDLTAVSFKVTPLKNTWFSLVVEDLKGKRAYSNPLWVNTAAE
ncbi:MAG: hypothetical protein ACI9CE_000185 [Flavobacterium sp.]|jgi:hypothetical protein